MASFNSTNNTNKDISETLVLHEIWIKSQGKDGNKAIFVQFNLSNFNFEQYDVSHAIFKNCNLSGAVFRTKSLDGTEFSNSSLKGAVFLNQKLTKIKFEKTDLTDLKASNVQFNSCIFQNTTTDDADIVKCKFIKCSLIESMGKHSNFHSSEFWGTIIEKSIFNISDFSYSVFSACKIRYTDFSGSEFHSSNLKNSLLEECKFESFTETENTEHQFKTIFHLAKFIDCKIKNCQFEEDKKSLKSKIVNTKNFKKNLIEEEIAKPPTKILSYAAKTTLILNFVIMVVGIIYFMKYQASKIEMLLYCTLLFTTSNLFLGLLKIYQRKIVLNPADSQILEHVKSFFLGQKIIFLIALLFPTLILFLFWINATFNSNFVIAFTHLTLFSYSFLVSLETIISAKKYFHRLSLS